MSIKNKSFLNYFYFFLVASITSLLLVLGFRVSKVDCHHTSSNNQELQAICQELETAFVGKSLLFYNFTEAYVWQELRQKVDYQEIYRPASLEKIPPKTLVLNLDSKLPDYRLILIDENKEQRSFVLNQNNHLKKDQEQSQLFEVFYQGQDQILDKNDRYLQMVYHQLFLSLQENIEKYQIPAKRLVWQKDDLLELDLGKSWLVILDKELDPEESMKNLSAILLDEEVLLNIQGRAFLDMRFRLPVIRDQL
jgi:hypothetical protein